MRGGNGGDRDKREVEKRFGRVDIRRLCRTEGKTVNGPTVERI